VVRSWLETLELKPLYIEPGSPWKNGYVRSFHGKLRDELLKGELFDTVWEAQVLLEHWRREYNALRPHSALGYRPPAPEAWSLVAPEAKIGALRTAPVIEKLRSCVVPS
jgi:transposase InsO family protein